MRYRHQSIRRVHIGKGRNRTRPIGIATVEDKIVQGALRDVLEAIYEQDFKDCSYGFRPGRSAHDALRELHRAAKEGEANIILEADIKSFFDTIDRPTLLGMLRERVADKSLMRLIAKCLHVGVLDGEIFSRPDEGTVQGSILSPLLGNLYLHYALDSWFEEVVKPRLKGKAVLIRYADDFLIGFEHQDDAKCVFELRARDEDRRVRDGGGDGAPDPRSCGGAGGSAGAVALAGAAAGGARMGWGSGLRGGLRSADGVHGGTLVFGFSCPQLFLLK